MSDAPCFIYAIATMRDGELCGPVKVGISSNPQARLGQLQTGCPYRLAFALLLMLDDRALVRRLEQSVLRLLSDHALSGEWLDIQPLEAVGEILAEFVQVSGFRVVRDDTVEAWISQ